MGKKKSSNWFLVKEISCLRYFASFPTEQKKYFGEGLQLAEHTKWDVSGKKKKKRDKERKKGFSRPLYEGNESWKWW